ncbi:glucose-1-phosphate adenylyltransferase [Wenzhouxiangella sp. XN79A]|uniref:glucose-1-phosphate adenylyltransferase n=1 Tax=Wenzhouxiangella sp. XN79A TaxID=2724193 RepID=UPI00144AC9CF|nr:glucose-1-phosphate adenylyltransferase [Wenzhouxiangella sp. XN79A]NKI36544.1 glucose-1-phosphate adenylyltransferase [Wenzhouxiangella sp. XN79A]
MKSARFVSRLTRQTQALILAGGRGSRLEMLTDWRAKPAVPFGGKFRIIDFALSNCLNSGIRKIGVLTQYKSHMLIRHLMEGWNTLNNDYGEFLDILPAQQWLEDESWYLGTADAIYQSLDIIDARHQTYVLVLAGDHVYRMDYGEMLAAHVESGADVTVGCDIVPIAEASEFGIMEVDERDRVVGFEEKPDRPKPLPGDPEHALVSMGLYVFGKDYLHRTLQVDAQNPKSSHDFGKDILPTAVRDGDRVFAFPLDRAAPGRPYWRDVGTVDSFYRANLELVGDDPPLDLHDPHWPIFTNLQQSPPARFTDHGPEGGVHVRDCIVSNGCRVADSRLEESLLFNDVEVNKHCRLDRVLALPGCRIGRSCRLSNVLLDNGCQVPEGTVIGEDPAADAERFHVTEGGVVVVNRAMLGQDHGYLLRQNDTRTVRET